MAARQSLIGLLIFAGLLLTCFAFGLTLLSQDTDGPALADGPRVGVVKLGNVITDATARKGIKALRQLRQDPTIKAIVVRISSPGGLVGPAQELYREVDRTRKHKPVVASLGSVAASGGYYVAAACDRIVASPGTITGSIGVISQTVHAKELLDLARVQTHTFVSGKFKDTGTPTRDLREDERAFLQGFVQEVHGQFLRDVARGRKLPEDKVRPVADGRVLTGARAKALGLVDELGNFSDALQLSLKLAKIQGEDVEVEPGARRGLLSDLLAESIEVVADSLRTAALGATSVQVRDPSF